MKVFISPSIMVSETKDIESFVRAFEEKNVENIHFDVMDGHFVENIMLGTNTYKDLKGMTDIPIDLHFMCLNPEKFIDYFKPEAGDWISFHPETTSHPHRLLEKIKSMGCKAGYALNPGTPLEYVKEVVDLLDYIIVMSVNPGFAGQTMVSSHLTKLERLREIVNDSGRDIDLIVDGNTTEENAVEMVRHGATGLVVGTSSLLSSVDYYYKNYDKYMELINNK